MDHLRSYDIPVEGANLEEHATLVKAKHLIYSDAYRGKTIVIGHRGGKFGPDNSMETIKAAVENQLEGIEFDVSGYLWTDGSLRSTFFTNLVFVICVTSRCGFAKTRS